MNAAFSRGEAILRLESLSKIIVTHLALITWAPEHRACNHWKSEINAFKRAMERYNKSKMKRRHNFDEGLVISTLMEEISCDEHRDDIKILVESHGVNLDSEPSWSDLEEAIKNFSVEICAL